VAVIWLTIEPQSESILLRVSLTPAEFGATLTSNERYFRYGEHPGRPSSSDPDNFLCGKMPVLRARLDGHHPLMHFGLRRQFTEPE
jgi:hypothetical protein